MKNYMFLISLIVIFQNFYSQSQAIQGDLTIKNSSNNIVYYKIETASIPFEGFTASTSNLWYKNRGDSVQNGCIYTRFDINGNLVNSFLINFHENNLSLGESKTYIHSSTQFPSAGEGVYGFAKYKITIYIESTNKYYFAYFNNLDSKYGDVVNGLNYANDFMFEYVSDNIGVIFSGTPSLTIGDTIRAYNLNDKIKEYKVWKIIQYSQSPLETDFTARSTPFPISAEIARTGSREYYLGTNLIIDTVWSSIGGNDKRGYNTDNFYFYNNLNILPITNEPGNIITTPAELNIPSSTYGVKIIADSGSSLTLKRNKKLIVNSNGFDYNMGDSLIFGQYSSLVLETNSSLHNYRGGITIFNSNNVSWANNSFIKVYNYSGLDINGNVSDINNGGHIEVNQGGAIKLGNNTTVTFDGEGTYLMLNSNSNIILGENAKIVFQNGARLIANGTTFSAAQNSIWKGLYFENSGIDDIQNCSFSGAEYPIDIKCETENSAIVLKTIKNNTFNLSGSGKTAIRTNNAINILIDGNTINMPSDLANTPAVYLRNALNFSSNGGNTEEITNIRIANNHINNGSNSIVIANYVSSLPIYIDNNVCLGSSSSPFIGRFITGTISNNIFDNHSTTYGKGAVIHQGNPGLFRNNIYSKDVSLSLLSGAAVNMSPSSYGSNQLLWIGGGNILSSIASHTINYQYSFANINYGHNDFYKTDALSKHLIGTLSISGMEYSARENCWHSPNTPDYNLINSLGNSVNVNFESGNYICNVSLSQVDSVMIDWGAGIYQYIPISNLGQQQIISQDELLYGQAVQQATIGSYPNAINILKQLINNYQSSQYLSTALYDLYTYYENLDTTQLASERDILYGNLKTYLNDRILSGLYDFQFESEAFYIIVMCEANMINTQLAVDDFQFLSLYHPQPEIRLLASWDYTELEALYGQGGSVKEFESEKDLTKYINKISQRIGKKFKADPLRSRMMKSYKKLNDEYTSKEETIKRELNKAGNENKEKIKTQKAELDNRNEMNKTASVNLVTLKSMPERQKEERRFNDLIIISGIKNTESKRPVNTNNQKPEKYELSQNYPNPFNPITNIQYLIAKQGMVTLKVYDMLGREIKTLVNEIKSPGKYFVIFDARQSGDLSSGVYFYRLESNNFVDVKRMILLK